MTWAAAERRESIAATGCPALSHRSVIKGGANPCRPAAAGKVGDFSKFLVVRLPSRAIVLYLGVVVLCCGNKRPAPRR